MKKIFISIPALAMFASSVILPSCDDENNVGGAITPGKVTIEVDSLFTVSGRSIRSPKFDSSVSDLLIGRLSAAEYGELQASFTGQLMPAAELSIPDTIPLEDVSGMTLRFSFTKGSFTGDTLAPQQLTVYPLTRQLPSDLDNTFDPTGYYDASNALGSASYTASTLGLSSKSTGSGCVNVPLNPQFARRVVEQYRTNPSIFQWPQTFAQYFPGIYVRSSFGRGLVLNFNNTEFITYYHYTRKVNVVENGVSVSRDSVFTDSTTLFAISPEVLSANLLRIEPAQSIAARIQQGQQILQSPAGYNVEIDFPAQAILDKYLTDNFNLGVINTLTYTVSATTVENDYGITPPPYLLMIKSSKMEEFFALDKIPEEDDTEAFWAAYDSDTGQYVFESLRPYIVSLMKEGTEVKEEDTKFTLVPVSISTELVGPTYAQKTVVTKCTPYIAHPTLCILDIPHSKVKFTYSRQVIQ